MARVLSVKAPGRICFFDFLRPNNNTHNLISTALEKLKNLGIELPDEM